MVMDKRNQYSEHIYSEAITTGKPTKSQNETIWIFLFITEWILCHFSISVINKYPSCRDTMNHFLYKEIRADYKTSVFVSIQKKVAISLQLKTKLVFNQNACEQGHILKKLSSLLIDRIWWPVLLLQSRLPPAQKSGHAIALSQAERSQSAFLLHTQRNTLRCERNLRLLITVQFKKPLKIVIF